MITLSDITLAVVIVYLFFLAIIVATVFWIEYRERKSPEDVR